MTEQKYKKMIECIKDKKTAFALLEFLYKRLPVLVLLCYPVMLLVKALQGFDKDFWLMLCVPAGVLVAVTAVRKLIDRQRPYEKFMTPPLFDRDGKRQSFPSRHTASAFIIAMSGFVLNMWLGIALLTVACVIGATRVLSGVHYITDVLAGAILSVVVGIVFLVV